MHFGNTHFAATHFPNVPTTLTHGDAVGRVYVVGGWVRDHCMGKTPKDRDFLVVGGSHDMMISNGFKQVGADFPVYLHPETGEEWALARTERKTGAGYHGFVTDSSPTITVEQDLMRRDLTINSMAISLQYGNLIDPANGHADLGKGILRHTSEAFQEDPLRVLRVARFAARYGFNVHKTTNDFMRRMVIRGDMNELQPDRIWAEMSRGLMEKDPQKMFQTLDECRALHALRAPWQGALYAQGLWKTHSDREIQELSLAQRFALCAEDFPVNADFYKTHRIPKDCERLAVLLNRWKTCIPQYNDMDPGYKVLMLSQLGAIGKDRNTTLYADFLGAFLAWGVDRFEHYMIPELDQMARHAEKINALVPPEDLESTAIAGWMTSNKMAIVWNG